MFKRIVSALWQGRTRWQPSWTGLWILLWALLLLLVWWLGPLLTLGESKPLQPIWARVVFTLFWLWLILGLLSWREWRSRQRHQVQQHEQAMLEQDPVKPALLSQSTFLDRWLQLLQAQLGAKGPYSLPWYLMLGLPGSGKSSLLQRSNQPNRLNPKLEPGLRDLAAQQCLDCWLGEEAVVLDPDGQLLLPEQELPPAERKHERLWWQLLGWLSQQRRRQPLNGLILTVDLAWLAQASVSERKAFAQLIRARLQELATSMNARLPLYVALTKLDLLRGFEVVYRQLDKAQRESILGITFTADAMEETRWQAQLDAFWDKWLTHLNQRLPHQLLDRLDGMERGAVFAFIRQLAGLREQVNELLAESLVVEHASPMQFRGLYLTSVYQQGVPFDAFSQATVQRYQLAEAVLPARRGESLTYFVHALFAQHIFHEGHLAGENRRHRRLRQRRLALGAGLSLLLGIGLVAGWQHYYRVNEQAGINVLNKTQAFSDTSELTGQQGFGYRQLPRLNLIREATLAFGNYRDRVPLLADLGLYQGSKIGPYVEETYLQLLRQRFLPAVMGGLLTDLQQAPAGSEQKMAVLRVMRMLDDASGRNKPLVEQFMAQRWQQAFPGQGLIQEQLLTHLAYALEHTDWHGARVAREPQAMADFVPFRQPIEAAQRELGKLPMFQRVYQGLVIRAGEALPPDLLIRDEVGPVFDSVFALRNEPAGQIARLMTYTGFNDFYRKQDQSLIALTAQDAWVLGQRRQSHLSEADRQEIGRQLNDRYVSDYVNRWQTLLSNLDVQPLQSPEQALDILAAITGDEQPFARVLTTLADNTRSRGGEATPLVDGVAARIDRPFLATNTLLSGQAGQVPQLQEVNQKLTELYHYLELIVNANDPGQSAMKAIQLRLSNKYADPLFTLQQYAQGLPMPLDRWVGQLAQQSSQLVVDLAMASLNHSWQEQVVAPFQQQLAGRYPFAPASHRDVPLSQMERFFAPGGILDSFYQSNLKPMIEAGLLGAEQGSPLQSDLLKQLARGQQIRETLFNPQGGLEVQFAVEPVDLSANKRRSVLNLDGQLLEYTHGRRSKIPLIWPNSMRDGAESKITLVPNERERSPRSQGYVGPWAMFRLMDKAELTRVDEGTFDVRFPVDNGAMTYRVYADARHNPFAGGLFSQFHLPDTLY